jgi:hypothetical protein
VTRILPFLLALAGCATARPEIAVVVVTFDESGSIARVESDDLTAGDPRRQACALFVGEVRASMRGSSAGAGSVTFGCPLATFTTPAEEVAR